jgi:hypothetical protein
MRNNHLPANSAAIAQDGMLLPCAVSRHPHQYPAVKTFNIQLGMTL